MDASSILGGIGIGKDTSGNFRLSPAGLAVRSGNRWVVNQNNQLLDVTGLTIDSVQNVVVRVPTQQVAAGDIIVLSDNPFNVLFVQSVDANGHLHGLELNSSQVVEYVPNNNLLGVQIFVKVVNLAQLFNANLGGNNLLPLLFLTQGNGIDSLLLAGALGGANNPLANLLGGAVPANRPAAGDQPQPQGAQKAQK
jgi:hypothetical protein